MSLQVKIVDPIHSSDWDKLLTSSPNYSFFHSSSWAKVLHESYLYNPTYFCLFDNDRLSALIPFMDVKSVLTGHRGVSLPFTDYCDPLVSSRKDFDALLEKVLDHGRRTGWGWIELRGGNGYFQEALHWDSFYRHTLDLSRNEREIFSKFRKGTKSSISKGIKDGVEVRIDNSSEAMKGFYTLHCMTRRKHGLPPQPYYFFRKIHEHAVSQGRGIVMLASLKGRPIGGAVFLHMGDRAIYKYGASEEAFLSHRPNNVILWEAIQWYAKNGYGSICFGRTDLKNEGLRTFKNGWGTREEVIKYYKFNLKKEEFEGSHSNGKGWHVKIMKKMPIPLLRNAGTLLYRHMG